MLWKSGIVFLVCIITTIIAQNSNTRPTWTVQLPEDRPTTSPLEYLNTISKGAEEFSLELFSTVCKEISGVKNNLMISPFSVWALLLLVAEGAAGMTYQELQNTLRISNNSALLREGYRTIQNILKVNTSTIEVSTMQAIFHDLNRPLNPTYEDIIKRQYTGDLVPINFFNPAEALQEVTKYIEKATRGLINPSLLPMDLQEAQLVMISSIYFKGQWKLPFNKSFTREEPFYNDDGEIITQVEMMTQTGNFNYAPFVEMQSHILELPYGKENRLSMLIIVPKKGVRLNDAIDSLRKVGLEKIFTELGRREELMADYDDDEVEVFLPKFITTTSITMNGILEKMGIMDVFQPHYADLSKMSSQALYLSRIIHQTKIEVNEEGTIAAAITSAIFANKASPPRFYLNRPFAYLIVEKTTRSLLFCGQVTKPVYNK